MSFKIVRQSYTNNVQPQSARQKRVQPKALALLLVGGILASCQTTNQSTEPPQRPAYQTQSERVVEQLAFCVIDNGNTACRNQAKLACSTIQSEAFDNPYSSGSTLRNFNNGDTETKARFKLSTANTVMRELGFGRTFCG